MNSEPVLGLPIVYLVDDEEVVRDALGWLLRSRRLLSEGFASGEAFEAMLAAKSAQALADWPSAPSCLLLDVRMPGMSGLSLFERLAEFGVLAALPVIFLTGHGDVPMSVRAMKAGAFDFLQKPARADALIGRVHAALRHDEQRRAGRAGDQEARAQLERLTKRERDVLALLLRGRTNKQVAREMGISPRTAEVHRRNILQKTRSGNLLELDALHRRAQKPAKA
jgi:two-component system response regulator DctR